MGGDQTTRHGIVVAKSIPAKKYGIHTADTVASAFKKCPSLVSVKPDHRYYKEKSTELMEYLRNICPRIQQVSIDECYMDYEMIRGRYPDPETAARIICDGVKKELGFTVNIGISDRKVLAKMASDFEKPDKVHTLYVSEIQDKLWPLPVGRLHMCGKSSEAAFRQIGIMTIGDLATSDRRRIRESFKSHGDLLWRYANGIDNSEILTREREVKSVGNSTTLAEDADSREKAFPILERLSASVSERLIKQEFAAGQVSLEIKYSTFRSVSHQTTLKRPDNRASTIYKLACDLFDELWDGSPIRLLGVRTARLEKAGAPYQMDLFEYQEQLNHSLEEKKIQEEKKKKADKEKRLKEAIGKIEKKYGTGAVRKGTGEKI